MKQCWEEHYAPLSRQNKGTRNMPISENKTTARRFFDVMNERNIAALDKILAAEFVDHSAMPGIASDRDGFKQFLAMVFAAFPDFHFTLEDLIAQRDEVAARFTARGTHKGEWMGIRPTGKQITVPGISIHRIAGGKITDNWVSMDMPGLMQQLGVIPASGHASR